MATALMVKKVNFSYPRLLTVVTAGHGTEQTQAGTVG